MISMYLHQQFKVKEIKYQTFLEENLIYSQVELSTSSHKQASHLEWLCVNSHKARDQTGLDKQALGRVPC